MSIAPLSPAPIGLGRTNIRPWRSAAGRRTRPWLARSMPAKPTLSVVPKSLPAAVVGPAVIGADEGAGVAAALRHRRAAMAADVGEGADLAVGAAGHQHRHAGHVLGEIVAGLGEPRRQAHEDRPLAEQPITLQAGALAAGIGRDAVAEHGVREVGGAAVDMAQQPPPDGQFFLSVHGGILVFWTARFQRAHDHERAGSARSGRS